MAKKTNPKPRRHYSDAFRAAALAALDANAGNVKRTARELDVPPKTLEGWAKGRHSPVDAELRDQKKGELSDLFESIARKLLGVAEKNADALNARDAVIAAATAVDKMRLLREQPTEIKKSDGTVTLKPDPDPAAFRSFMDGVLGAGVPPVPADGQ